MTPAPAPAKERPARYELSLAVWIPGIKLPFRLRVTTGDVKLLMRRVRQFRKEVSGKVGK